MFLLGFSCFCFLTFYGVVCITRVITGFVCLRDEDFCLKNPEEIVLTGEMVR